MIWLVLAACTAVFESIRDVFSKRGLRSSDEFVTAWSWRFFSLPFLVPLLLIVELPTLGADFWWVLGVDGALNLAAGILYMRAIARSDLSLTVPIIAFTPVFLLLTSPLILGEFPDASGVAGIVLIVAGSYILNLSRRSHGWLGPLRALFTEPGPRLMLMVAMIFSVTSNLDKIGVENSSPIVWSVSMTLVLSLGMIPVVAMASRRPLGQIRGGYRPLLFIGLFNALVLVCQMTAIELTLVAYVISIKRTSAVLSVLWGHVFFDEPGLRERAAGAALMVLGVASIALL